MSYYVYILECKDHSYYTGIATDVPARLKLHNAGLGAKYTRGRGPLTLVYVAPWENRSSASKEEARIKKLTKAQKKEFIAQGDPSLLTDYTKKNTDK